jgi:hypothetical protein
MFHYFADCSDVDQARAKFRELCKIHHPDTGGSADAFRAMVEEFQRFQKAAWDHGGRSKWGSEYQGKPDSHDLSDKAMERLRAVVRFPNVSTEILGTWIWCQGDTRQYREQFKALGFKWSKNKGAWFFHEGPYRCKGKRDYSLDDIRGMHGSRTVDQEPDEQVA